MNVNEGCTYREIRMEFATSDRGFHWIAKRHGTVRFTRVSCGEFIWCDTLRWANREII